MTQGMLAVVETPLEIFYDDRVETLLSRRHHECSRIACERDDRYRAADSSHFNASEDIGWVGHVTKSVCSAWPPRTVFISDFSRCHRRVAVSAALASSSHDHFPPKVWQNAAFEPERLRRHTPAPDNEDNEPRRSGAGHVSGMIVKVHTKNLNYKGYVHHASKESPHEIKSDKTNHIALHRAAC
jgi:DUF2945 family protein